MPAEDAPAPKRVALALGSGGARGYAHIGVIEALRERGAEIVAISGASMGAIVGGIHAAGKLDEYRDWVTDIGQFEVLRLLDVALTTSGAIKGDKVFGQVGDLLGDVQIEDLPISFTAVAADLITRREIWFQHGPLALAIRASSAIPSLLPPVEHQGRLLADGGLLNPVPIAPTAAAHADLVIGVNLNGDWGRDSTLGPAHQADPSADEVARDLAEQLGVSGDDDSTADRIRSRAAKLFDLELWSRLRRGDSDDDLDDDIGEPDVERTTSRRRRGPGKFDIMNLSIETMQAALTSHRLAAHPPDILVNVPKNAAKSLDFHRADELIALGHLMMSEAWDRNLEG